MSIFDELQNKVVYTFAQLNSDSIQGQGEVYFSENEKAGIRTSSSRVKRALKLNSTSFLCGLSGTVACGAFSAMLFAFIPASIAAGLSCSAAFSWVCGHA